MTTNKELLARMIGEYRTVMAALDGLLPASFMGRGMNSMTIAAQNGMIDRITTAMRGDLVEAGGTVATIQGVGGVELTAPADAERLKRAFRLAMEIAERESLSDADAADDVWRQMLRVSHPEF